MKGKKKRNAQNWNRSGTGWGVVKWIISKEHTHQHQTKSLMYRQEEKTTPVPKGSAAIKQKTFKNRLNPSQLPNLPSSSPSHPPRSSAQPIHEATPRSTLSNAYARVNDVTETKNGNYGSPTLSVERSPTSQVLSSPLQPSVRALGVTGQGKAVEKLVEWIQSSAWRSRLRSSR
jgi:hypothetical protein